MWMVEGHPWCRLCIDKERDAPQRSWPSFSSFSPCLTGCGSRNIKWECSMAQTLNPFYKFTAEGAAVGRLLLGYSNLEIDLMNCVQMACGGNLNAVLKRMYSTRGKSKRIGRAEALGHPHFAQHHLTPAFQHAIAVIRRCLQIRNQYAHWALWDDSSGKLAFANLESLAKLKRPVNDLRKLRTFHVNATLLAEQEAYYIYCDRYTSWLNFEIRFRAGALPHNILPKPKRVKRPRLKLK